MLCPTCKVDLQMSERQGVEIDYCPKCRGVWLDRGELDKILERSRHELAPPAGVPPPPPAYGSPPRPGGHREDPRHDPPYDPRYEKRRKRNFLEEFFD